MFEWLIMVLLFLRRTDKKQSAADKVARVEGILAQDK